MKLIVALLTCDRYEYTVRTVDSLLEHNDVSEWNLFYADDASTDARIRPYVESKGFEPLVLQQTRKGCSPTTEKLIQAMAERVDPSSLILYLQNDFESLRSVPLPDVERMLEAEDAGFVQLAYRRPRHRRSRRIVWSWPDGQLWLYGDKTRGQYVSTAPGVGCGYHPTIAGLHYWAGSIAGVKRERQF